MERVWDARGEAREALARVVSGFGTAVLGQADMLEGLLRDDVPQLPREVAMLTETARFGVAELLAERVRQGVSAPTAVSMVATEMTSRTAVDAMGALWASGVFAHVIGFGAGGPTVPPVPHGPARSDVTRPPPGPPGAVIPPPDPALRPPETGPPVISPPTRPDPGTAFPAPPTRQLDRTPPEDVTPAAAADWPGNAAGAIVGGTRARSDGLAEVCAAATGITVVLLAFWALTASNGAEQGKDWAEILPLLVGGIAITVMAARARAGGAGIAAVLGLTVPAIAYAVYDAAIAAGLTNEAASKRYFVIASSVLAVFVATAAAATAAAGLARLAMIGPQRRDGLSIAATLAGLAFVLSNIFGQDRIDGFLIGNVLGPGVKGWFVLWGLVFLAMFAIPPVVASFVRPGSPAQLGLLSGWLLLALVWQISDSPVDGFQAAYGLYLTWICWMAVLAAAIALGARRAPRDRQQQATQFQQEPWQPF